MNVLLNGCSFMDNFYYSEHAKKIFDGSVVNLAKAGSSNRRIIRTTVDYLEKNPIDLVLLGLSFYDRQESPFSKNSDPWVSYNSQGIQAVFSDVQDYESQEQYNQIGKYVLSRYRYDINHHYLDSLYLDLLMLTGYLKHRDIRYCIFTMCDRHFQYPYDDKGIIKGFIANAYLGENNVLFMDQDKDLPINARHHYGKDAIILIDYVRDYCRKNNIL